MNVPEQALALTKVRAATRQTDEAIRAMQRGDLDIAITLAGAAEGMLKREGSHLFQFLRDSPKVAHLERKEWVAVLNRERDWLKHVEGADAIELNAREAAAMIARAASKLEEWTPLMECFKSWYLANFERLNS